MRIMLFVHAFNGRAIADVASCISAHTALDGHDVVLVAGTVDPSVPRPREVELVDLRTGTNRTTGSIAALRGAIRHHRPQALFAHGNGPARAAVVATRGLSRRPTVVTAEHNHYSSYPWRMRRLRNTANRLLLPRADVITGVAPEIVEDLERLFPGVRGRTAVVAPPLTRWAQLAELAAAPVEHPWFVAHPPGSPDRIPVIISVANIHPRKDPETLVRAVARVRRRWGAPVRLALIGRESDPSLLARLRLAAGETGDADDIAFLGFRANPLAYVARSDVFALTSRNEGMPISLLEAMALGVPVVSTDCLSGPRFLLEGGKAGELATVGDPESVAAALLRVLEHPERAAELRRAGPQRVLRFTPARITEDYLRLLDL
jgi:glycosyltransferase involved in cell wall biosynthesis